MASDIEKKIDLLIASEIHDPFEVLGFHPVSSDPPKAVIRAFHPHAESMRLVVDGENHDMYKMREEGLFEIEVKRAEPFDYRFEATFYNGASHAFRDPYRTLPLLGEEDRYLFNKGENREAYNHLGAHEITVDGVSGVVFRVWAPEAIRVSVIGDFNAWDGRVHQMRVLGPSGIWELFIPGIAAGEIYKYEIKTKDRRILEKADPFQFRAELRPRTASIVHSLEYEWNDKVWMEGRRNRSTYRGPVSIYEVHLGSWQRDPADTSRFLSYRELADTLVPYVKNMGFTHVELLPVMEHPLDESWGYQCTGYFAATSRYGTPEDLMFLIDRFHQNDIGVILDWVPSHFPADGHGLENFDGTALYEHQDPRQGSHPEWGTKIFNYGRDEVRGFLIANALFWIEKFHADGLRADAVASMLYLDYGRKEGEWVPNRYGNRENIEAIEFIRELNRAVGERFPEVMMIAEESTSFYGVSKPVDAGGLGFGYKWNMGWMNDMLHYFSRDPVHRKYHHNSLTFSLLYAFTENFILPLSHDEVVHGKRSLLSKMPGDKWQQFANLRLLYTLMWTHPGKKLLFMGGEFGQISEWFCKVSLDWHLIGADELHQKLQEFVRSLNLFYRDHPALFEVDFSEQGFQWMDFHDVDNSIIAFARFSENRDDHLVCLLNFTPNVIHDYRLGVPELTDYEEVFNSDAAEFGGSGVGNPGTKVVFAEPYGNAAQHIMVSVPPLAGIIFRPARKG